MRIYYLCSKSRAQAQSMPKKVCNENCIRSVILTVFVEGLTAITEEQQKVVQAENILFYI